MHEFETFRKDVAKDVAQSKAEPHVTIQRRGLISLNAAAYRALGKPTAVEMLYNADERIVGLRAVDPHAGHSYLVRPSSRSGSAPYLISATAFTRYYEIDTSTAVRRVAYSRGDMLCIDLDAPDASAGESDGDEPDGADGADGAKRSG